jgi:hypothetical protein
MRIALRLICNYSIDTWIKVESLSNVTNLNRITAGFIGRYSAALVKLATKQQNLTLG